MANDITMGVLLVQIILAVVLIVVIVYLVRVNNSLKLEKRFSNYTIKRLKNDTVSIFDQLFHLFDKMIKALSKELSKSQFLVKSANKYEKHIYYDDLGKRNCIDFISIKIYFGIFMLLLYIFSSILKMSSITMLSVIFSFIIGYYAVDVFLSISYSKKRKEISEDLLKSIMIMNNAFKSGKSITQAIKMVSKELDGAIKDEFKKMNKDLSFGLSLETAFQRFYDRVRLEDAKYIIASLTILNNTGGNIIKVFDSIEKEFINRKKLQNELKSLTSTSMFVFKLLLALPFVLFIVIYFLNPAYFVPLYTTGLGVFILILMLLIYFGYVLVVKKVLRVDL